MAINGNTYTYSTFENAVDFINTNFAGKLYAVYGASSGAKTITIYKGTEEIADNQIMRLKVTNSNTASGDGIYIDNGSTQIVFSRIGGNYNTGQRVQLLSCSNGLLIYLYGGSSDGTTFTHAFITFNDNGDIIMGTKSNGSTTSTDPPTSLTVYSADLADDAFSFSYTINSINNTGLCYMMIDGGVGINANAQNAFFMIFRQYDDPGILTLNGEQYITNGYWCIKD